MLTAAIVLLSFLVAGVYGGCTTPYSDCGKSGHFKVTSISIPNCCAAPCVLKRGTNASVTIDYITDTTYANITQKLCGELKPSCIGLKSLPHDFCQYTTCPVQPGKPGTAKIELPIEKDFPPITIVGNWTFYGPDDPSTYIGCFEVPLKLE